ncbi:MAG: SMP-30/gluconolactonase/LRE family protein [Planctomycetota bacterium]|nr:SMP-30/gluconolactonase/LRE family protein [Planctomycetota bacterium]
MGARVYSLTLVVATLTRTGDLASAQAVRVKPDAVVDLASASGAGLVKGVWRACDAGLVSERSDGRETLVLSPRGEALDSAAWTAMTPEQLTTRRGAGGVCFSWYELTFTMPEQLNAFDARGASVVLELVVDDYAEVWVDGRTPLILGQRGGVSPAGFSAPNRITLSRNAEPGRTMRVRVLAINGPISVSPSNRVWVRSASLEFFRPGRLSATERFPLVVERRDPRLAAIVAEGASAERLASGFEFTEGPVWVDERVAAAGGREAPGGYLLFSDPNANAIYRLDEDDPDQAVSVFRPKSGYAGADIGEYRQPGSNGITLDPKGRVAFCQHGERRVVRVEHNGDVTVLADRDHGKRLNSPNDLVFRSDGALFFTDPAFGLPTFEADPRRELTSTSVYFLKDGKLKSVSTEFSGPNGLALAPDERTLYIGNWDPKRKVVARFGVSEDGTLTPKGTLIDLTQQPGEEAIDGVKVDAMGNVYVSGPGGLWIVAPDGTVLGRLELPEHPHNMAFGGSDGRSLYLTAETSIYRVRLLTPGIRPIPNDSKRAPLVRP